MDQALLIRWTLLTEPRLQELWPGKILDKDLILVSLENEVAGGNAVYFMAENAYGNGVIAAKQ